MPDEPEAVGLLALMLLTEARRPARTAADGSMVRLADQDRTRWDRALDRRGPRPRARLPAPQPARARSRSRPPIAAVHADAPDRRRHRLVADRRPLRPALRAAPERGGRAQPGRRRRRAPGPDAGLAALDELDAAALDDYQPFHAARADLLARAGRTTEAVAAYDRAIELTTNPAEHRFLTVRRDEAATPKSDGQARP